MSAAGQITAGDRLTRLLSLVPYLTDRQGVPLAQVAQHFQVSEEQVVADLQLLFVCGTPGHFPDDLIEAEWEEGRVYLRNADSISTPLRLGTDEAMALLAALQTLAEIPGSHTSAVRSALQKLQLATVEAVPEPTVLAVDPGLGSKTTEVLGTCQQALQQRARLQVEHIAAHRDKATMREIAPMRVVMVDGHWYLEGWCYLADEVRLFRLDRVLSARILDRDGTPPPQATSRPLDEGAFLPSASDTPVVLELSPSAHWVAEYYPVTERTEGNDGSLQVTLLVADTSWVTRMILRSGGAVRALSPPNVVASASLAAYQALQFYHTVDTLKV